MGNMATDPSVPAIKQVASNIPYLIAAVVMILISTIAVLVVVLFRPDKDNTAILTIIGGFTLSAIPSVLGMMKAQETHLSVNSQMEAFKAELVEMAKVKGELANREGMLQGTLDEQARVAVLTKESAAAKRTAQLAAMAQAQQAPAAPIAEVIAAMPEKLEASIDKMSGSIVDGLAKAAPIPVREVGGDKK